MRSLDHRSQLPSDRTDQANNVTLYYVIFVVYAACLYGVAQKSLYELDQKIVPSGDAMTYSIFFYKIINEARDSIGSAYLVDCQRQL